MGRSKLVVAAGFCVALSFVSPSAMASPIFQINTGTLTVTGLISGTPTYDIRGAVLFNVSDPGAGIPSSLFAVTDSTGGTDPSGSVLPFGNAVLTGIDMNTGSTGTTDTITADFADAIATPGTLLVPGIVTLNPPSAAGDPLLNDLVTNSPLQFLFTLTSSATAGDAVIEQFQLTSVDQTTPEPLTSLLCGTALILLAGFKFVAKRTGSKV